MASTSLTLEIHLTIVMLKAKTQDKQIKFEEALNSASLVESEQVALEAKTNMEKHLTKPISLVKDANDLKDDSHSDITSMSGASDL